ncbi:hypothetical protein K488DRAFT_85428 [Vararia minispora EC-137]|uniref:Uncharacterized protein n=1 Tax=Vararia minispora EC-137 TaxID=1314806 RepID=A0ACB8QNG3_9AGAM|nr:hypothetical protein K488DRAFT_85428 [Vararia minispora EC-137]
MHAALARTSPESLLSCTPFISFVDRMDTSAKIHLSVGTLLSSSLGSPPTTASAWPLFTRSDETFAARFDSGLDPRMPVDGFVFYAPPTSTLSSVSKPDAKQKPGRLRHWGLPALALPVPRELCWMPVLGPSSFASPTPSPAFRKEQSSEDTGGDVYAPASSPDSAAVTPSPTTPTIPGLQLDTIAGKATNDKGKFCAGWPWSSDDATAAVSLPRVLACEAKCEGLSYYEGGVLYEDL